MAVIQNFQDMVSFMERNFPDYKYHMLGRIWQHKVTHKELEYWKILQAVQFEFIENLNRTGITFG